MDRSEVMDENDIGIGLILSLSLSHSPFRSFFEPTVPNRKRIKIRLSRISNDVESVESGDKNDRMNGSGILIDFWPHQPADP